MQPSQHLQRILQRRQLQIKTAPTPDEPCHKCGKQIWDKDLDPGSWYCFICGNTAWFRDGKFIQDCDFCNSKDSE